MKRNKSESPHEEMFTHCLSHVLSEFVCIEQQLSFLNLRRRVDLVLIMNEEAYLNKETGFLCSLYTQNDIQPYNKNQPDKMIVIEIDGSQHNQTIDSERDIDLITQQQSITDIIRIPAWAALYYPYVVLAIIYKLFPFLFGSIGIPIQQPSNLMRLNGINDNEMRTYVDYPYCYYGFCYKEVWRKENDYWLALENGEKEKVAFDKFCYQKEIYLKHLSRLSFFWNRKLKNGNELQRRIL